MAEISGVDTVHGAAILQSGLLLGLFAGLGQPITILVDKGGGKEEDNPFLSGQPPNPQEHTD